MSDEELLTNTRQRRANAGSRLKQLLKAEEIADDGEDENEIDLLFQEDEDDAEFQVGDKDRYGYEGSGDEAGEEGEEEGSEEEEEEEEEGETSRSRSRSRSRSASIKTNEENGVDDDDDSEKDQIGDHDDMFSDSEDDDSGEEDSDEGERELQKQERVKKRQAQKKARQIPKITQKKTTSQPKKKPTDIPKADTLLSLSRRQSSRMTAVQNKMDLVERLKEDEARRSSIKPVAKVEYVEMTQEEKLAEALETEKYNISTLNKYKEQEIDKKKKQRALQLSKRKRLENIMSYKTMPIFVTPVEEHELERFLMNRDTIRRKRDRRGRKSEKQKREEEEAREKEEARKKRAAMFIIHPKSPASSPEQIKKLREENLEKVKALELPESSLPPESTETTAEPTSFGDTLEKAEDEVKQDENQVSDENFKEDKEKNHAEEPSKDENMDVPKAVSKDEKEDKEISAEPSAIKDGDKEASNDTEPNDKKRPLSTDEDETDHKKLKVTDAESSDNEIVLITPKRNLDVVEEKVEGKELEVEEKTENKENDDQTNSGGSQIPGEEEPSRNADVNLKADDADGNLKADDTEDKSTEESKDDISEPKIKSEDGDEKPIKSVKFAEDDSKDKDEKLETKSREPSIEVSSRETSATPEQPKIVFEGPPQKVGANFVSFEESTKRYTIDEIKGYLFGKQSLLGPTRKSFNVETIYKVRADDEATSQFSTNMKDADGLPDFEFLNNFPKFGEYNKVRKEQVVLETRQDIKVVLKTQPPSGIHLPNGTKKQCLITGKPAMYFDPKTGLPYSSVDAYKVIKDIQNGIWAWTEFPTGGAYVCNRDNARHAKEVPEGFDE